MDRKYGVEPLLLDNIRIDCNEMMLYMYLPIYIEDLHDNIRVPERLKIFNSLIYSSIGNVQSMDIKYKYMYLTVKCRYVDRYNLANRPGWHSDGFGTDDINVIWCDNDPTVFSIQDFDLSDDHNLSMKEMTNQCNPINNKTYNSYDLLLLDQYVIHRSPIIEDAKIRTFFKLSFSNYRYNLIGNSHNYLFDYKWDMHQRQIERNHPIYEESDIS